MFKIRDGNKKRETMSVGVCRHYEIVVSRKYDNT